MSLASRFNKDKLQWSLVDFKSFEEMVRVLEFGAQKYAPNNWKKGLPVNQICESTLRHLFAFMNGEDVDEESKLNHIAHAQCNLMFLQWMLANKPELDNRVVLKTLSDEEIFVCEECGSEDIEERMWVGINDGIITDSAEDDDCFCNNCNSHQNFILKSNFKK